MSKSEAKPNLPTYRTRIEYLQAEFWGERNFVNCKQIAKELAGCSLLIEANGPNLMANELQTHWLASPSNRANGPRPNAKQLPGNKAAPSTGKRNGLMQFN